MAVEEDQMSGVISERQVIHPKKLHHRCSFSACSLRIELAYAHETRWHRCLRGRDDLCRLPRLLLPIPTRRRRPTGRL
jgi:hypothetical protein